MRFHALVLTGSTLLLGALGAARASAHPGITGYSGKPYNGVSETCTTNCHAKGGAAPALTITVPASVQAGSTNAMRIVVAGNKPRTSMNAAFSDGVKTTKGLNTDTPLPKEEPTEIAAVVPPPSGATGTYDFTFTAPPVAGTITMWVAGMAASGNGTNGDGVAAAMRTITVTGGVADAGSDSGGPSDAGGSEGGGPGDGGPGAVGSTDAGGSSSGSSGTSGSVPRGEDAPDDGGGCGVASTNDAPGGFGGLTLGAVAALGAWRLRRRSPRSR